MQNEANAISGYLAVLEKVERATEHTQRPALKALIETISQKMIVVFMETKKAIEKIDVVAKKLFLSKTT